MWNTHDLIKEKLKNQYLENHYESGIDYPVIKEYLYKSIFYNKDLTIEQQKTMAMCYMLRNSKIEICKDEFFFDKFEYHNTEYCNDPSEIRSLMPVFVWELMHKTRLDISSKMGEIDKKAEQAQAYITVMDFGHIAPDWQFLMQKGIPGVIERLEFYKNKYSTDKEKQIHYQCGIDVYNAICDFMLRAADLAQAKGGKKMLFVAENLRQLTKTPPKTLAQGMQLTLIFYTVLKDLESTGIRSLGGLDNLYYPLYKDDLESGRFTESQLRELTRDFLWKISAMNIPQNVPCYIGGRADDGKDKTNSFTKILLEEYRSLKIISPKIHVLYHENIDKEVLKLILEMIRDGTNSLVFCNVDIITKALEKTGADKCDAKKIIIYGCYEPGVEGLEIPCAGAATFNIAKAVELALFNGVDVKTGIQLGVETGEDFNSFDKFFDAVKLQLKSLVGGCIDFITECEKHYKNICPTPILSATFSPSVEKGIGLFEGGAKYNNTSIIGAGIATAVDSVFAVKKVVFEQGLCTFKQLKKCLLENWKGYESLHNIVKNKIDKFGNNIKDVDDVAIEISKCFKRAINNRENGRGGVFRCGMFSITTKNAMGATMIATPDGREDGEPLSKNFGATVGQDKNGVTALMQSQLKIDATELAGGTVADILLHTSSVKGEDGLIAFRALLETYMKHGGFATHFNVLNKEILLNAQREPEKYKNLQVRLCGWNVYFVDLSKREQDEFVIQASVGE